MTTQLVPDVDPLAVPVQDPHATLDLSLYRLRTDRCVIEVSGRIGPVTPVRLRFRALTGAWTTAIGPDPSVGPGWLEVQAQPILATPGFADRYVPARRSMARTLDVVVGSAPGGTSGPAIVEVSDGATIAWRFRSRLRVVCQTEDTVLVDLTGTLEPNDSNRHSQLKVWLRAAAEFVR